MKDFKPSGKILNRRERQELNALGLNWCAKCESLKDPSEFSKNSYSCKPCKKIHADSWKSRNKDYYKNYREENTEARRIYNQEWFAKNKDKARETKKKYRASQRENNPQYRIVNSLRCRVNWLLRNKVKIAPTLDLLGCSLEVFTTHLEAQFKEGMSWDNYGNPHGDHSDCWHIDHIKPCSLFDLSNEEQQKECFHYSNMQPLWGLDNCRKGNRY